ncbi:hypothetical protein BgiBS90_015141, partial [Biomphalaria glabrata]
MPLNSDNRVKVQKWRPLHDWQEDNIFMQRRRSNEILTSHIHMNVGDAPQALRIGNDVRGQFTDNAHVDWLANLGPDGRFLNRELPLVIREDKAQSNGRPLPAYEPQGKTGSKLHWLDKFKHNPHGLLEQDSEATVENGKDALEFNRNLSDMPISAVSSDIPAHHPEGQQGDKRPEDDDNANDIAEIFRVSKESDWYAHCLKHLKVIDTYTELQQGIFVEMKKQVKLDSLLNRKMSSKAERLTSLILTAEQTQAPAWIRKAFGDLRDYVTQQAQAHNVYVNALTAHCTAMQQSINSHQELMEYVMSRASESSSTLRDDYEHHKDIEEFGGDGMSFLQASNVFEDIRRPRIRLTSKFDFLQTQLATASSQLEEAEAQILESKSHGEEVSARFKLQDFKLRAEFLRGHLEQLRSDIKSAQMEISDYDLIYRDKLLEVFNVFHQHRTRYDNALKNYFQLLSAVSLRDSKLTLELLRSAPIGDINKKSAHEDSYLNESQLIKDSADVSEGSASIESITDVEIQQPKNNRKGVSKNANHTKSLHNSSLNSSNDASPKRNMGNLTMSSVDAQDNLPLAHFQRETAKLDSASTKDRESIEKSSQTETTTESNSQKGHEGIAFKNTTSSGDAHRTFVMSTGTDEPRNVKLKDGKLERGEPRSESPERKYLEKHLQELGRQITEIKVERGLIAKYCREPLDKDSSFLSGEVLLDDSCNAFSKEFQQSPKMTSNADHSGENMEGKMKGTLLNDAFSNLAREDNFQEVGDDRQTTSNVRPQSRSPFQFNDPEAFQIPHLTKSQHGLVGSSSHLNSSQELRVSELINKYAKPKRKTLGTNYNNCETIDERQVEAEGARENEDKMEFEGSEYDAMDPFISSADLHNRIVKICAVKPIYPDPETYSNEDQEKDADGTPSRESPEAFFRRFARLRRYEITAGLFTVPKENTSDNRAGYDTNISRVNYPSRSQTADEHGISQEVCIKQNNALKKRSPCVSYANAQFLGPQGEKGRSNSPEKKDDCEQHALLLRDDSQSDTDDLSKDETIPKSLYSSELRANKTPELNMQDNKVTDKDLNRVQLCECDDNACQSCCKEQFSNRHFSESAVVVCRPRRPLKSSLKKETQIQHVINAHISSLVGIDSSSDFINRDTLGFGLDPRALHQDFYGGYDQISAQDSARINKVTKKVRFDCIVSFNDNTRIDTQLAQLERELDKQNYTYTDKSNRNANNGNEQDDPIPRTRETLKKPPLYCGRNLCRSFLKNPDVKNTNTHENTSSKNVRPNCKQISNVDKPNCSNIGEEFNNNSLHFTLEYNFPKALQNNLHSSKKMTAPPKRVILYSAYRFNYVNKGRQRVSLPGGGSTFRDDQTNSDKLTAQKQRVTKKSEKLHKENISVDGSLESRVIKKLIAYKTAVMNAWKNHTWTGNSRKKLFSKIGKNAGVASKGSVIRSETSYGNVGYSFSKESAQRERTTVNDGVQNTDIDYSPYLGKVAFFVSCRDDEFCTDPSEDGGSRSNQTILRTNDLSLDNNTPISKAQSRHEAYVCSKCKVTRKLFCKNRLTTSRERLSWDRDPVDEGTSSIAHMKTSYINSAFEADEDLRPNTNHKLKPQASDDGWEDIPIDDDPLEMNGVERGLSLMTENNLNFNNSALGPDSGSRDVTRAAELTEPNSIRCQRGSSKQTNPHKHRNRKNDFETLQREKSTKTPETSLSDADDNDMSDNDQKEELESVIKVVISSVRSRDKYKSRLRVFKSKSWTISNSVKPLSSFKLRKVTSLTNIGYHSIDTKELSCPRGFQSLAHLLRPGVLRPFRRTSDYPQLHSELPGWECRRSVNEPAPCIGSSAFKHVPNEGFPLGHSMRQTATLKNKGVAPNLVKTSSEQSRKDICRNTISIPSYPLNHRKVLKPVRFNQSDDSSLQVCSFKNYKTYQKMRGKEIKPAPYSDSDMPLYSKRFCKQPELNQRKDEEDTERINISERKHFKHAFKKISTIDHTNCGHSPTGDSLSAQTNKDPTWKVSSLATTAPEERVTLKKNKTYTNANYPEVTKVKRNDFHESSLKKVVDPLSMLCTQSGFNKALIVISRSVKLLPRTPQAKKSKGKEQQYFNKNKHYIGNVENQVPYIRDDSVRLCLKSSQIPIKLMNTIENGTNQIQTNVNYQRTGQNRQESIDRKDRPVDFQGKQHIPVDGVHYGMKINETDDTQIDALRNNSACGPYRCEYTDGEREDLNPKETVAAVAQAPESFDKHRGCDSKKTVYFHGPLCASKYEDYLETETAQKSFSCSKISLNNSVYDKDNAIQAPKSARKRHQIVSNSFGRPEPAEMSRSMYAYQSMYPGDKKAHIRQKAVEYCNDREAFFHDSSEKENYGPANTPNSLSREASCASLSLPSSPSESLSSQGKLDFYPDWASERNSAFKVSQEDSEEKHKNVPGKDDVIVLKRQMTPKSVDEENSGLCEKSISGESSFMHVAFDTKRDLNPMPFSNNETNDAFMFCQSFTSLKPDISAPKTADDAEQSNLHCAKYMADSSSTVSSDCIANKDLEENSTEEEMNRKSKQNIKTKRMYKEESSTTIYKRSSLNTEEHQCARNDEFSSQTDVALSRYNSLIVALRRRRPRRRDPRDLEVSSSTRLQGNNCTLQNECMDSERGTSKLTPQLIQRRLTSGLSAATQNRVVVENTLRKIDERANEIAFTTRPNKKSSDSETTSNNNSLNKRFCLAANDQDVTPKTPLGKCLKERTFPSSNKTVKSPEIIEDDSFCDASQEVNDSSIQRFLLSYPFAYRLKRNVRKHLRSGQRRKRRRKKRVFRNKMFDPEVVLNVETSGTNKQKELSGKVNKDKSLESKKQFSVEKTFPSAGLVPRKRLSGHPNKALYSNTSQSDFFKAAIISNPPSSKNMPVKRNPVDKKTLNAFQKDTQVTSVDSNVKKAVYRDQKGIEKFSKTKMANHQESTKPRPLSNDTVKNKKSEPLKTILKISTANAPTTTVSPMTKSSKTLNKTSNNVEKAAPVMAKAKGFTIAARQYSGSNQDGRIQINFINKCPKSFEKQNSISHTNKNRSRLTINCSSKTEKNNKSSSSIKSGHLALSKTTLKYENSATQTNTDEPFSRTNIVGNLCSSNSALRTNTPSRKQSCLKRTKSPIGTAGSARQLVSEKKQQVSFAEKLEHFADLNDNLRRTGNTGFRNDCLKFHHNEAKIALGKETSSSPRNLRRDQSKPLLPTSNKKIGSDNAGESFVKVVRYYKGIPRSYEVAFFNKSDTAGLKTKLNPMLSPA